MKTTHVSRIQVRCTPCVGCPKQSTCFGAMYCPRKTVARQETGQIGSHRTA
jgi:hypothetical protein